MPYKVTDVSEEKTASIFTIIIVIFSNILTLKMEAMFLDVNKYLPDYTASKSRNFCSPEEIFATGLRALTRQARLQVEPRVQGARPLNISTRKEFPWPSLVLRSEC
jgi:hypothetical protein